MNAYQFLARPARCASIATALCLAVGVALSPTRVAAEDMKPVPAPAAAANPANTVPAPTVAAPPLAPALAPATDAATKSTAPTPNPAAAATPAPPAATKPAPDPGVPARLLPHELSPWGMFLSADIIVKVVMIGLASASVITWTVWLAKSIELFTARRRTLDQLGRIAEAESLGMAQSALVDGKGAVAQMVAAAAGELQRSADLSAEGIKERAAALIARIEARAGRQMNRGTGALATIGATAPFIGLFGTVWGIMNSFIGISKTNTTNLAVVAPGIAEALLATAIGLVAAIPAVMIYNIFARGIATYRAALGDAAAEILRHLSRDLDRSLVDAAEDDGEWRVVGMRQSAE